MKRSWIFQGVPSRIDVADPRKVYEGKTTVWLVSRYRDDMQTGDIVYLWRAGEPSKRGIYAWGTMEGEPAFHEKWGIGVPVLYRKRLPEHLPASILEADSALQNHLLFRMAVGTNFSLSPSEASAIERLIGRRFGPEYSPKGQ